MLTVNLIERPFVTQCREARELRLDIFEYEALMYDGYAPEWLDEQDRIAEVEQELGELKSELARLEEPLNELFYEVNQEEEEELIVDEKVEALVEKYGAMVLQSIIEGGSK